MTSFSLNIGLPFFNFQATSSFGAGAAASASAGNASASAGATSNAQTSGGFSSAFNQLDQASGQQQQQQNPLIQMFMQMMQMMMQMMMQLFGMGQQQGQPNASANASSGNVNTAANASSNPAITGNNSAAAAASSSPYGASASAAASSSGASSSQPQASESSQPAEQPEKKKGGKGLLGLLAVAGIALIARFPGLGMSPLVLDTNKDGKVSAEKGKGVDIDGDGKPDGAASGGDKMLAMGDVNGNGKIDGSEVFGNKTVDPFTGKQLNAANGFDALNQVAKSAKKQTGIDCIDDSGNVDLAKLRQAIQQQTGGKGSLGYISGDNVTQLESLESQDAVKINTNNYVNQQDTGSVQHNQLGSYIDSSGLTQKVDDVWFV
ncbi:MAG: hypothetical protein AB1782_12105 [Cyanobacteriota bacterium]